MNTQSIKNFIESSAKQFKMNTAEYLEKVAKKNYVIVHKDEALTWDDENIMVLNSLALALDEAEGTKDKIMSEYKYYQMKKAI